MTPPFGDTLGAAATETRECSNAMARGRAVLLGDFAVAWRAWVGIACKRPRVQPRALDLAFPAWGRHPRRMLTRAQGPELSITYIVHVFYSISNAYNAKIDHKSTIKFLMTGNV